MNYIIIIIILLIFFFLVFILIPYGIYKLFLFFKKEWLSYISVILYFIFIFFSNNNNGIHHDDGRTKLASVKSNMHTFQTMIDTYSMDVNGNYPKNVTELKKFATTGKTHYWRDFKNPYTRETGKGNAYDDFDKNLREKKTIGWFFKKEVKCSGCVYYSFAMNKKGELNNYFIYGSDKNGEIITDAQTGFPFVLSNN